MRVRQEEALRAREELIENMEHLAQETSRQTERTARQKDERRREIDLQVNFFVVLNRTCTVLCRREYRDIQCRGG